MPYLAGTKTVVDTGDSYFREISSDSIAGRTHAIKFTNRDRLLKLPVSAKPPIEARIEHARFIVDCPCCNSAEFAFEANLFFCSLCKNSDINGDVRKVKMPSAKDRKDIEDILGKRSIKNRHWRPGETLDSLKIENLKAGILI